eukprot:Lithocolla_globosa_v1_NODE_7447_length_946_cov_34.413019.p1 type:complete len:251 gc:universal NODE_7447_length_946_cov_34.413019:872-120(-)
MIWYFSIFLLGVSLATPGVVPLDDITFDKLVDGSRNYLVRFHTPTPSNPYYDPYSYGETESDDFLEFVAAVNEIGGTDLMLAEVIGEVNPYGSESSDLSLRFDINTESGPVYLLFPKSRTPIVFKSETPATKEDLVTFVMQNTRGLKFNVGTLEEFDEMVTQFWGSSDKTQVVKETEEMVENIEDENRKEVAKYYLIVMKKVIEKGEGFLKTEIERLDKVLKGSISTQRRAQFQNRLMVLSSFRHDRTEL